MERWGEDIIEEMLVDEYEKEMKNRDFPKHDKELEEKEAFFKCGKCKEVFIEDKILMHKEFSKEFSLICIKCFNGRK